MRKRFKHYFSFLRTGADYQATVPPSSNAEQSNYSRFTTATATNFIALTAAATTTSRNSGNGDNSDDTIAAAATSANSDDGYDSDDATAIASTTNNDDGNSSDGTIAAASTSANGDDESQPTRGSRLRLPFMPSQMPIPSDRPAYINTDLLRFDHYVLSYED